MIEEFYDLQPAVLDLDRKALELCREPFAKVEEIRDYNQLKMLRAFTDSGVEARHFWGSSGYGVWDDSRNKLEEVFARCMGAEAALVRPQFMSGTHTLAVALFGLLRPGDTLLAATGRPYDTLEGVIGLGEAGKGCGTLREFGVLYEECPLRPDHTPDYDLIARKARTARVVHIQRSRGYTQRNAFDLDTIRKVAQTARAANPDAVIFVDNCYGEFVEVQEPSEVGADLMVGSLIKNPGGGLAPIGGYIVGKEEYVENAAARLTSPGLGKEVGATLGVNQSFYQGFFLAPTVTASALKGAVFAANIYERLGFPVIPNGSEPRHDIIQAVTLGSPEAVIAFCRGIQAAAPVDSYVAPEPWAMPGYDSDVIMAAGAFVQGSSIELSADGPIKPPYAVYFQGGLTWEHAKFGILMSLQKLLEQGLAALPR